MLRRAILAYVLAAGAAPLGNQCAPRAAAASTPGRLEARTPSAAGEACTYSVSPGNGFYSSGPNRGVFIVVTESGCAWTAKAAVPWITLGASNGIGSGAVTFTIAGNPSLPARSGEIRVAGQAAQ